MGWQKNKINRWEVGVWNITVVPLMANNPNMSKGDAIIIDTVLNHGVPSGTTPPTIALTDLSADQIIKSVLGCLNVINHGSHENSSRSSDSVSSRYESPFSNCKKSTYFDWRLEIMWVSNTRFRLGMKCAQECLALGYPDKSLGYQSFLYSNNPAELRSIFMFLVELMQAKNGQDAKENANGMSHVCWIWQAKTIWQHSTTT